MLIKINQKDVKMLENVLNFNRCLIWDNLLEKR